MMNYHDQLFRCIVAGCRTFRDYKYLEATLNLYLCLKTNLEIVSGGQVSIDDKTGEKYGADYLGEQYAKNNKFHLKVFPADWNKYGKAAGPMRNEEMAKYADGCICFWDNKSKGTKSMIELAKRYELKLVVVTDWIKQNSITER